MALLVPFEGQLFRGLTAAASLKGSWAEWDRSGCASRLFRGPTAAASLKGWR